MENSVAEVVKALRWIAENDEKPFEAEIATEAAVLLEWFADAGNGAEGTEESAEG